LISYDEELAHKLQQDPAEVLPLVCLTTSFINRLLTCISSKQP
jgi:hypothetical protein